MKHLIPVLLVAMSLPCYATSQDAKKESSAHYEKALTTFDNSDLAESFIHVKNALQADPNNLSAKILLAKIFFNDGDLHSAERTFEECLAEGSDINLILPLYGATLALQQKADKLLSLKKYASKFNPSSQFEWQLLEGQAHLLKGNTEKARTAFLNASEIRPTDTRALNILASYYLRTNNLSDARRIADKSISLNDRNERTWQLKGDIAKRGGQLDEALVYLNNGYQIAPEDPKILRDLAKIHIDRKEGPEAKQYLEKILRQSPNDPQAQLMHALVILSEGNLELGNQLLGDLGNKLSVSDESKDDGAQSTLFIKATTEFIQGNHEKARTLLGNYLLNNPNDIAAIRMLVDLHLKNNNIRPTILLLESHRKFIAKDFGLIYLLANLYIQEGKYFTATQEIKILQEQFPHSSRVSMLEADILKAQGKSNEALELLQKQVFVSEQPLTFSLKIGAMQLALGRIEAAAETADNLLQRHPESVAVLNFAAATALKQKKPAKARQHLEHALTIEPKDLTARFNHALTMRALGDSDQALAAAKAILTDAPEHVPSIVLISEIRTNQKEYDEALEWLDKVNAYDRTHIGANELRLKILTQSGDLENAVKAAQFLYRNGKDSTRYLAQEAELLIALEKYSAANKPLVLLYSLWENEPQQLRRLADMQIRAQKLKAARKSLEKALSLDGNSMPIQLDLARLSLREGNLEAVTQAVEQLNDNFGNNSYVELLAADLANTQKQPELARKHYTTAFNLDKNNSRALMMLYQLTLQGVGERAFTQLLEHERNKGPIPNWAQKLLADSYLNQEELQQAQNHYEQLLAIESLSNNSAILNNLANIYARTDLDKALTTAKKALENNQRNPSLLDTIGWIYLEKNMPDDALFYLREASALDSSNPEIRYHQGIALAKLQRTPEAIREFKAALQLNDAFKEANDARAWLEKLQN